ncbi:MAG: GntR family transcriptional regulator [Firmicutes bacterium]|nr:GntR family transcriptional regulator [Bacillota bacterium]
MKREVGGRARYEEIAQDLAKRIAQGELTEGARILGRSSLAGTYQVSPETIRRAVAILHERGIVQSVAGSGIRVMSRYAAVEYLDTLTTRNTLEEGARELRGLLKQRRQLDEKIDTALDRVLSQATGALASRHVEEITVKPAAWVVGRSLGEIRLRSWTGATAVAVTRADVDHFSPPADMLLAPGDVITVIGSEAVRARAKDILDGSTAPPDLV